MSAIGRHVSKLAGYAPALPTPFDDQDDIDVDAFAHLCDLQIANGATALVVCGTTGEAPTLSRAERGELIRIAVGESRGHVPVIAGAGSNATAQAIELSKVAEANGADAILSVVPYYNKPTQEGLYAHYCEVAASTGLPIILYDVPSRTGRGLADETVARLAEVPQIIGLKDAAGDITRPARLRALLGSDFRLFCGDDAVALAYFAEGGDGCISVTSNVAPALCRSMFLAWKHGQIARRGGWQPQSRNSPLRYFAKQILFRSNTHSACSISHLLGTQSKAELANVLARLCAEYSESMIGKIGGSVRAGRRVAAG
jgi:4-hydroxy-tetrahydrodipicolinate synthase